MLSFGHVSDRSNNHLAGLPRPPHDSPPLPPGSVNPAAVLSTPADQKKTGQEKKGGRGRRVTESGEAARRADATDSRRFHSITAIKRGKKSVENDSSRCPEEAETIPVCPGQSGVQHKGNRKASFFLKPAS